MISSSACFNTVNNGEAILTPPEVPSMFQTQLDTSFAEGLLRPSNDYSHTHYHPYHVRHSYQASSAHESCQASRYIMMADHAANHYLDNSVDAAFEMSASSRGLPPVFRKRTQSLDGCPSMPMTPSNMDASLSYAYYPQTVPQTTSLPGSPSSSYASPAHPMQEPNFSSHNFTMDSQLHPFSMPMPTPSHHHYQHSPSPSLSNSFQSFPSPMSGNSTCNSPSLSSPSPILDRKRFSTDSTGSQDTMIESYSLVASVSASSKMPRSTNGGKKKQRYYCDFPGCDRTFSRPYNLKSHGLTHDINRPHACEKCAKTFARIHDRDRHMNSHMPQKPHVCIVCTGRFARQDAVIRHLKLSNATNACAQMLIAKGISFRDAAAGRATREHLGEEMELRETFEALEEEARKTRATRTLEMMGGLMPTD
ncbi:MAG: hypothetical protein J3Q66DRAFT_344046 [Benniella sp.]|nr:MAG: hypothetical protein J3Q66DRAFT_344046 [Benniella sp.]